MRVPKYLTDPKSGRPRLPPAALKVLRCPLCRQALVRSSPAYLCCPAKLHGLLYQAGVLAVRVARALPLRERQRRKLADDESGRYAFRILSLALRVLHAQGAK